MRHWSESLVLCLGASASLFFFGGESPLHMRDGNWGLAMAHCNVFFWLTLLCAFGALYTGSVQPLYRGWAIVILLAFALMPETRDFVEHWLFR
jgi:hypothetical protein